MKTFKYIGLFLLLLFAVRAAAQSGFNPDNPPEPLAQYKVSLNCTPPEAGYTSGAGKYTEGTQVSIRTSSRGSNYEFVHWMKDGEVYSTEMNFTYTVEPRNVTFTAVYRYNPSNPPEPTTYNEWRIYLEQNMEGAGSFNRTSGAKAEAGTSVWLKAYNNQGFRFLGWYEGSTLLSTEPGFYYTMPEHHVTLTAKYRYDPDSPADPQSSQPIEQTDFTLPDVPFEFFYNAADYDALTRSIPNHPSANLAGYSLQLSANIPQLQGLERLCIENRCEGYINKWAKGSTESGSYFFRTGSNNMTIVCKVKPSTANRNNASDFISNRGGNYNYMWRIGDSGGMYLHTSDAYSPSRTLPISFDEPQILAVRVNGSENYILLENLTTGESLRVNQVNWGGSNNVFKFFYNDDNEFFLGDFYWVYYSFNLLSDKQLEVFKKRVIPGDVNDDGSVDVADFMTVANYILNNPVEVFIEEAADVCGNADGSPDGKIDVADFMGIANIILHKTSAQGIAVSKSPRKSVNDISTLADVIYVEPVTVAPGTRQELSVQMKNASDVSAFEFSLQLPEGITVASEDGILMTDLSEARTTSKKTNYFDSSLLSDGSLRILCGSIAMNDATGKPWAFAGHEGEVARITVEVPADYEEGTYEVSILNAKTSDSNGIKTVLTDMVGRMDVGNNQTTGISLTPNPSPKGEGSGYYTLDGQKYDKKPSKKGVYIHNGKIVVVK